MSEETVESLEPEIVEENSTPAEEEVAEVDPLVQMAEERDAYLLDLQRVSAEFANFRKQNERRNAEVAGRAQATLVNQLLPVLDACDLAVDHAAQDVLPIQTALLSALEAAGLEVINPLDSLFDPNCHEAVLREEGTEGQEQQVIEVLRHGYVWAGQVIRPAMVKVRG
ncbi:MAG TPA: nucleotide exchange factor GrpE [Acidimicrobiia bacterium]|nr:nucleotide exchange factor GrpE [Acidimicrobiia bacterium]HIL45817.1 nucleotide exchange factor GrpE [Acidimicrobiia bacterium]